MSFKPNIVRKKSDDVIFIKQEIDLTQSTDYETSVTRVSERKYVLNHKIKSIPLKLAQSFNKTNTNQVRIINSVCQHVNFLQHFWPWHNLQITLLGEVITLPGG